MAPRIYICLCGFRPGSFAQMRHHRRKCEVWKNRPDPKGLARKRRSSHRKPPPAKKRCDVCGGRSDHHLEGCPNSLEERARQNLLKRHEIDPEWFELFLEVLAKRYQDPDGGWRKF